MKLTIITLEMRLEEFHKRKKRMKRNAIGRGVLWGLIAFCIIEIVGFTAIIVFGFHINWITPGINY